MKHQLIVIVEVDVTRKVERTSCILCISDIQEGRLPLGIGMEVQCIRCQIEQVTCSLHIRLDSPSLVVIRISETNLHDEEVLVVIAQDRVARRGILQILVAEGLAYPRHIDIVQVEQVNLITIVMTLVVPLIFPRYGEHSAMELRTILHIVVGRELRCSIDSTTEATRQERSDKSGEGKVRTDAIFHIVITGIALQSSDGLVGTTQFDREILRTTKDVTVLEGQRGSSA